MRLPAAARWALLGAVLLPATARADLRNFDIAGKIYTKWLYRNDDSQGLLSYGNPFWLENITGNNGVGGEFELTFRGQVSKAVTAGARVKSRFGALWQDWWENGNMRWPEVNTSAESLGMDHAEYMKLRGYWIRVKPPIDALRYVHVGSSDLSQFDEWTIGKIRYIDRDNGKGVFLDGRLGEDVGLEFHLAAMALPKLWVGPNWSTGIGDTALVVPFWAQDWAYGARLGLDPGTDWKLTGIVTMTNDLEVDRFDPDAVGSPVAGCEAPPGQELVRCETDHAVDLLTRYRNLVGTLLWEGEPTDALSASVLAGHSASRIDERLMANGVADNAGVYPLVYKNTGGDPLDDSALRVRAEWSDPFEVGLSLSAEYFYVGEDWTSIFGARREADVLLTDGFAAQGQLPTLNLANEFIDYDEPWYEAIIGWHGGTLLAELELGDVTLGLEGTGLTYNTNGQDRDVDHVYPTFQHSEGFTDTDLYDYANTLDRGRDLRSVYREDQDRKTGIGVLKADWSIARGWRLHVKAKGIYDVDGRDGERDDDDYAGTILQGRAVLDFPVSAFSSGSVGAQLDAWREDNRSSDRTKEFYRRYETDKHKVFARLGVEYMGAKLGYQLEYIGKEQRREGLSDQLWRVVRSKAFVEAAW